MRKVLNVIFCFFCMAYAFDASAFDFQAKEIFDALKAEPIRVTHPEYGYEMISKSVPGFVDCRLSTYENGVQDYGCSFGTHDGFSMADRAYDFIEAEEVMFKVDNQGKWYRKSVGGLVCNNVVFHRPVERSGSYFSQLCKCEISLSFGMLE